jgi:LacI family transcriptional regulator
MRRATIRDVAARAGVHPATASRALNPNLPGRITEATAERVREAASALGYQADPTARSLRTRRSGTVGVVVPDLTNPVLAPIVRAIQETLWVEGLACLVTDTDNRIDMESTFVAELEARRCEGLIVATATRDSAAVARLVAGDVPVVLVTREPDDSTLPYVGGDDEAGVEAAIGHLVDLGHRRIAHLAGPERLSTTVHRVRAFRAACVARSIEPGPILHGSGYTVEGGLETMRLLLAAHPDITAVVAGNDMMALGAYDALDEAGKRCPDDISIVGHNDMPFMARVNPPLTTVAIPQSQIGVTAAEMLLELRGGTIPDPMRRLIPTRLVVRGSTRALG